MLRMLRPGSVPWEETSHAAPLGKEEAWHSGPTWGLELSRRRPPKGRALTIPGVF